MPPLAQRNLFHDKGRLTVTLTGIVFSVVLIVLQLDLFFGFTTATSNLTDHSGAHFWFKTSPYVFTTFKNAQNYTGVREDQTMFILVKVAPGASLELVRRGLLDHIKDVEVFTTGEFSHMTTFYWMFTTGAGVAVLIAAVLGLGVGFVGGGQAIYAQTMGHNRRNGKVKAEGGPHSYVYKSITQAGAT